MALRPVVEGQVVAPSKSHHLIFLDFLRRFPDAQGHVAAGPSIKRPDLAGFMATTGTGSWNEELQGHFSSALRALNETVWFHGATGTLILADLLCSFSTAHRSLTAAARALGVYDRLAMFRTMRCTGS